MPQLQESSDPRRYLDPLVLQQIGRLELKARLIVEGFISGLHKSPYHGFSVEFAEHREYVPGDDLRYIDWKVFGRSDRVYIKQYEEETNLRAYILLDASESMAYPYEADRSAGRVSKFEYACYVAASIAYLSLKQQDAVGLSVFDSSVRSFLPPSSNPSTLQNLVAAVQEPPLREKTDVGAIFHEFADRIRTRALVIVISDMLDDVERVQRGLRHLRYKGHEVVLFHVLDRDELTFPFQRMTLFEGMEGLPEALADPRALRSAYLAELEQFLAAVRRVCRDQRIDYVRLDTAEKLNVALSAYLAARAGSRRA
jgi:uncharacterized protein (DUF58 family)